MRVKSVTLEVLKLSGWLNTNAPCRESKGGHAMWGELRAERQDKRRATAGQTACRGGRWEGVGQPRCKQRAQGQIRPEMWGAGHERGAHGERADHVRDLGRVKAQGLVERYRDLPRVERRACVTR